MNVRNTKRLRKSNSEKLEFHVGAWLCMHHQAVNMKMKVCNT